MRLRKSKKAGFQSIGKQHTEKRYHGINLSIGVGTVGVIKTETKQTDTKIQESGHDSRNAVPKGLSCQFFYTTQNVGILTKIAFDGNKLLNKQVIPALNL